MATPTYVSAGTVGSGSTSVTPGLPASLATGDGVLIQVVAKPDTATITTPTNWTLIADVTGGGGTVGTGTGPTHQVWFFREKDAGWSTMPAITVTSGTASAAIAYRYTKTSGTNWDIATATGVYNTGGAGTNMSSTLTTVLDLKAGDAVHGGYSNQVSALTYSAESWTATGISAWGTVTEITEVVQQTTTPRVGGMSFIGSVTTGTASAAPVMAATASGNSRGTAVTVRLREVTPITGSETPSLAVSDSGSLVIATNVTGSETPSISVSDSGSLNQTPTTNLLTNPSFETNTTGWSAPGGTTSITRQTSGSAQDGVAYATMSSGTATGTVTLNSETVSPAYPNTKYSASAYLRWNSGTTPRQVRLDIQWLDGGGSVLSSTLGTATTLSTGSYTRVTIDGATPNASTAQVRLRFQLLSAVAGDSYDIDAVMFEETTATSTYNPAVASTTPITGSETPSLAASDVSSTIVGSSTSTETNSLAVSDVGALAITTAITASETNSLAASDVSSTIVGSSTSTETNSLAVSDSGTLVISTAISASETNSLATTETSTIANSQSTSETNSLSVAETSLIGNTQSTTDAAALSVSETAVLLYSPTASETNSLSVAEAKSLDGSSTSTETNSLSETETSTIANTQTTTDTSALSVSDSSSLVINSISLGTDAIAVSVSDVSTSQSTLSASDTSGLAVSDASATMLSPSASETNSLAASDVSSAPVIITATSTTDAASLSEVETSAIVIGISTTDAAALSVSDSSALVVNATITASETNSLAVAEAQTSTNSFTSTETPSLSVSDSGSLNTAPTTNILTNPSFETDVTAWTPPGSSTLTRTTSGVPQDGVAYATFHSAATGTVTLLSDAVPGVPNKAYSAGGYFRWRTGATPRNVRIDIQWLNSGGTAVATVLGTSTATNTSGWTRITNVNASTSDGTATQVRLRIQLLSAATNDEYDIDAVLLEQLSALSPYNPAVAGGATITGSESPALSVADGSSVAVTSTSTDTAALSVADTSSLSIALSLSASETNSLAASDTSAIAGSSTSTETNSLSVGESAAAAKAIVASETNSLAVTDSSSVAITTTPVGTDSIAVSVSDVSASSGTLSRTDTSAVSVVEAKVLQLSPVASESPALSVSDVSTTPSIVTSIVGTDNIAVGAADVSSHAVSSTRNDPVSLSVADSSALAILAAVSTTDASAIVVGDSGNVQTAKAGTESPAVSVVETSAIAKSSTTTDGAAVSIAEATTVQFKIILPTDNSGTTDAGFSLGKQLSATENSGAHDAPPAGTTSALAPSTDNAALAVSDVSALKITNAITDNAGSKDSETVLVAKIASGTEDAGSTDSGVQISKEADYTEDAGSTDKITTSKSVIFPSTAEEDEDSGTSDADGVDIFTEWDVLSDDNAGSLDKLLITRTLIRNDDIALSVTETANNGNSLQVPATDGGGLVVNETSSIFKSSGTTDVSAVSAVSAVQVATLVTANDSTQLSVIDLNVPASAPSADSAAIGVVESASVLVAMTRTDTSAISETEASSAGPTFVLGANQSVSISVADVANVAKSIVGTQTHALSVTESRSLVVTRTASDAAILSASSIEFKADLVPITIDVKVYHNGAWVTGVVRVYKNGVWVTGKPKYRHGGIWV